MQDLFGNELETESVREMQEVFATINKDVERAKFMTEHPGHFDKEEAMEMLKEMVEYLGALMLAGSMVSEALLVIEGEVE